MSKASTSATETSAARLADEQVSVKADRALVAAIVDRLDAVADPDRAPAMQAYMKSEMAYLGVAVPVVRSLTIAAASEHPPDSVVHLGATATALWRGAVYREHRYAATELVCLGVADSAHALLPLYEEMIVTGAWWDHVDRVASRLGQLLIAHPATVRPLLLDWSQEPDRWLRRTSIIAQRGAKTGTDLDLLASVIDANVADPDFFVRKAIGWALRDYARTDPDWVRRFVAERSNVLSSLSRREALKHLG